MKFYIRRLGCPKNDVDADYIAARIVAAGHEAVDDPEEAEVVIVNTCGFIQDAKEESVNEILNLSQLKESGKLRKLLVSGCLSQRYGQELLEDIPEIDGVFGLGQLDAIAKAVKSEEAQVKPVVTEAKRLDYLSGPVRFIADNKPYAYLKISDGCNRNCSFCAIPGIRGRFRSRSVAEIVKEAEFLARRGKRELILVSQDTTLYGRDLKPPTSLTTLLKALDPITEVSWIRVMYLHPASTDDNLIEYMSDPANKTLGYFDLPLQHVNSRILKAMNRPYDHDSVRRLIEKIRTKCPKATMRGTFIVGFPGETASQFQQLYHFLYEQELHRAAAFAYSPEEETGAATLTRQVSEKVKYRRLDDVMSLQQEIAFNRNGTLIGTVQEVMLDSLSEDGTAVGRTRGDCPDIDQEVIVRGPKLTVGDICRVRIEATEGYDLLGSLVGDDS